MKLDFTEAWNFLKDLKAYLQNERDFAIAYDRKIGLLS